jgi:hypothetical protein
MATYYFHLRDGEDVLLDPDGRELPDITAVVARALAEARAIIAADAVEGAIRLDHRIDVQDHRGAIVHSLQFADAVLVTRRSVNARGSS